MSSCHSMGDELIRLTPGGRVYDCEDQETIHMKYLLLLPILGNTPEIEIDEADFWALIEAKKVLSNCLSMEKKYEILLSNYLDFEQQILQVTASHMIRGTPRSVPETHQMMSLDVRLMIDLRLVNLLSSARLYVDHLPGHIRGCLPGQSDTTWLVKSLCAAEYESKLEYRFMEALRNHVQHRGLAVHEVGLPWRLTDPGGERLREYSLRILSLKSRFELEGKFKKQVLNEIPDEIDLKSATRCYIESLSNIHIELRKLIDNSVAQSRRKIEDAFCLYHRSYDREVTSLKIWKLIGEEIVKSEWLFLGGDDIRKKLQARNGSLSNLDKRFVTNK